MSTPSTFSFLSSFDFTFQMDKKGCATLTIKMSTFTKIGEKAVQDALDIKAQVEEEGTGKSSYIL